VQWILEINLIRCSVGAEGADYRLDLAPTTPTNWNLGNGTCTWAVGRQAGSARTKVQKKARSLSSLRPEAKSADEFYYGLMGKFCSENLKDWSKKGLCGYLIGSHLWQRSANLQNLPFRP
jgi:hypothetical protein